MENVTKVVKCIPGNLQSQGFMEVVGIVSCTGCYYMSVCKVNDQWKFYDKFIDKDPVSWVKIAWFLVSGNRYPALLAYHRVDGYKSTANFITSLDFENLLKFSKKQDVLVKQRSRNTERSKDDLKSQEKPPLKPSLGKTSSETRDTRNEALEPEEPTRKSVTPIHKKYDFSDFRLNRPKEEPRSGVKKSEQGSPRNKEDSFRSWEKGDEMERIYLGTPKESQPVRSFSRQEESLVKLNYTPQRPDKFSHFSPKDQEKQNPSPYFRDRSLQNQLKDDAKNPDFRLHEFSRENFATNNFRNREEDDRGEGINRDDLQSFEKNRIFDSAQKERFRPSFENFNREDLAPRRDPDESLSKNSKHFESLLEKYKDPKKDLDKETIDRWKSEQVLKDDANKWKDSLEGERRKFLERNDEKNIENFRSRGKNEENEGNRESKLNSWDKDGLENWKLDQFKKDDSAKWKESMENERKRVLSRNDEKDGLESWKVEERRNDEISKWRDSMENERKRLLERNEDKALENFRFRAKNEEFEENRDLKAERVEDIDSFQRRIPAQENFDPSRFRPREEKTEPHGFRAEDKPSDAFKEDPRFKYRSEDYFDSSKARNDALEKFRREEKLEDYENLRFRLEAAEAAPKSKFEEQEKLRSRVEDSRYKLKEEKPESLGFRTDDKPNDVKKEEPSWFKYRSDSYFDPTRPRPDALERFRPEEKSEDFQNQRFRLDQQESVQKAKIEDQEKPRVRIEDYRTELRAQDLNPYNESESREKPSIRQFKSFDSAEVSQKYKFLEQAEEFSRPEDPKPRSFKIDSPAELARGPRDLETSPFSSNFRKNEEFKPRESEKREESGLNEWSCAKCNKKVSGASYECAECRLINWDQFYKVKSLQHNRSRAEEPRNDLKDLKENNDAKDEAVRRLYSFSDKKDEEDWVCAGCNVANKSLFFLCKGCRKPKTMSGAQKEYRFSS